MVSGNDKSISVLYRAVLVICVFLVFGMILNGVVMSRDRILEEKGHQTSIRISLIREEYERKMGDLRLKYKKTCEQTVQEVLLRIKQNAKEAQNKQKAELKELYTKQLQNQSDEIESVKEQLKKLSNVDLNHESSKEKHLSKIGQIEKHLSDLKSRILRQMKSDDQVEVATTSNNAFSKEEEEILSQVTERLKNLELELDKSS